MSVIKNINDLDIKNRCTFNSWFGINNYVKKPCVSLTPGPLPEAGLFSNSSNLSGRGGKYPN
jgi:hypothetical protein